MINLQILEFQTVLLIFKLLQTQIFQLWVISESVEIVVHQYHTSEVLNNIEGINQIVREP
jgi:hypothetical protein